MNQCKESNSYNIDNNENMEDDTQYIHNEQNLKELNDTISQQDLKVNINTNNNIQCTNNNSSSNFVQFCVGSYTCENWKTKIEFLNQIYDGLAGWINPIVPNLPSNFKFATANQLPI